MPTSEKLRAGTDIAASALVPAPAEVVFDFLSDLENHWRLVDRFVEVLELDGPPGETPDRGRVRLRGPLGVHRTVMTRVDEARRPELIVGTATLGDTTRAYVTWTLEPDGERTRVHLGASVDRAGRLDRLMLALGGRVWLRRRFRHGLARLVERYA